MSLYRKIFRIVATCCLALTIIIMTLVASFSIKIPEKFNVVRGKSLSLPNVNQIVGTSAVAFSDTQSVSVTTGKQQLDLKLWGIFPVKSTSINLVDRQYLTPGGTAFGIKLFTKGVMVIGVNSVETKGGICNPAKLAGIIKGDMLLSINSVEIGSNEQIKEIIENSKGENVTVTIERNGKMIKTILTPVESAIDNAYRCGLWVRDSSAGIGTVTYYNDDTMEFGGLGHGICDVDTGKIMPLNRGQVCEVKINGIKRGKVGTPGELRGGFSSSNPCGSLANNNNAGIFGTLIKAPNTLEEIPIMLKQEVKRGDASIICTLDTGLPKRYSIKIEKIDLNPRTLTKNMVISVTDTELLDRTGGIIQGMSGSPIVQNGMLVGAVTHVFVNNPQKGYGIFIENMLEQAG